MIICFKGQTLSCPWTAWNVECIQDHRQMLFYDFSEISVYGSYTFFSIVKSFGSVNGFFHLLVFFGIIPVNH